MGERETAALAATVAALAATVAALAATVAALAATVAALAATVAALAAAGVRLRPRFRRGKAPGHACASLRGLRGDAERKNGWQLAEPAGYGRPRAIQRALGRSVWDADAARDDLREFVVEALGAPDGALAVDETGFLKQGTKSVGVRRQYSGPAGRIENGQVGVFLGYAGAKGRAGIGRALSLPRERSADPARRAAAGAPTGVTFRTKPQPARALLARALEAGVPAAWVTADEGYGNDDAFRQALETRAQADGAAVNAKAAKHAGGRPNWKPAPKRTGRPSSGRTRSARGPRMAGSARRGPAA